MINIEKKLVGSERIQRYGDWSEFLAALMKLKIGESFLFRAVASNHRLILGSMPYITGAHFRTHKEKGQWRIGRIK